MKSNLDIWAIQSNPDELYVALNQIKKNSQTNILFSNCVSQLHIGDQVISNREFDTMLYAEDSDTLILVMKNALVGTSEIREYLEKQELPFHEVVFEKPDDLELDDSVLDKEVWFVREASVLEDAISDSKEKGFTHCEYYPELSADLEINYFTLREQKEEVDGRNFMGVVEFSDKVILFVQSDEGRNLKEREVYRILSEQKISTTVVYDKNISCLESKSNVFIKK